MNGVIPTRRASVNEELRHVALVEVLLDRCIGRRTGTSHECQHLILLDQAAGLLQGLWRRERIVERYKGDAAAVDAALLVEHAEISEFGLANDARCRNWPAIGHGLADLNLAVCYTRTVFLLRGGRIEECQI